MIVNTDRNMVVLQTKLRERIFEIFYYFFQYKVTKTYAALD